MTRALVTNDDGIDSPALLALAMAVSATGLDVVLSGHNYGANTGRAVLHTGTVGAALTAGHPTITALRPVQSDLEWRLP